MSEVTVTDIAHDFGAHHTMRHVGFFFDILRINGLKVAGPATTRVKLRIGGKQSRVAAYAAIYAIFAMIPVLAREGALGSFLAGNVILFRGKLSFPFSVGFIDF